MVTAKVLSAGAALGICVGLFATPGDVAADTIVFDLTEKIDKDNIGPEVGDLTATFEDDGTNQVKLTLSFDNSDSGLKVFGWYFNFIGDATKLQFSSTADVSLGDDAFKADGDGFFDVLLSFPAGGTAAFNAGESLTFTIFSTTTSFDVHSFESTSAPGGGNGTFRSAAHIGGFEDPVNYSVWMGAPVPLPAAAWGGLLLFGGLGAHRLRRRRA